jgi:small subunit ribosomal protein S21
LQNYRNNNNRRPRNFNQQSQGQKSGIYVEVRNGDVNAALRKFKKKVQESGVLQEYRERQEYVKPSEKRKMAKAAAKRRHKRAMEKRFDEQGY